MYKRIHLAFLILIITFGILISNLGVIAFNANNSPASQNRSRKSLTISTSRGMIYDTNMKKIVNHEQNLLTVCLPSTKILNSIKEYLTEDETTTLYENMADSKISILQLPKKFYENQIKSVYAINRYASDQHCVHLVGHLDESGNGVMGLEKAYNDFLVLNNGELNAVWNCDAIGNILWGEGINFESSNYMSPAGIQLTIDLDIQNIAEESLINNGIDKGAVVILNSNTNEILAMASVPTFNPNNVALSLESTDSPFLNRAITPYSIGSVFKPFVACCAIENNIDFTYNCTGSILIGNTVFKCSNNVAHGNVNMDTAMQYSCNTYFIALGQEIGAENLLSSCEYFGLGKSIELADNFYIKSGVLPHKDTINSPQALANLSFGQGDLLATPLHLAVAYSCFANGGYYQPPTLMKAIIDENGNTIQKVKLPQKYMILNESTINVINEILKNVVYKGNGINAYSTITENHGKTATAQSGWYENGKEINHTWFCGYFSDGITTYTVVIFKDDGQSGATDCAPVFKEISENVFQNKSSNN